MPHLVITGISTEVDLALIGEICNTALITYEKNIYEDTSEETEF